MCHVNYENPLRTVHHIRMKKKELYDTSALMNGFSCVFVMWFLFCSFSQGILVDSQKGSKCCKLLLRELSLRDVGQKVLNVCPCGGVLSAVRKSDISKNSLTLVAYVWMTS